MVSVGQRVGSFDPQVKSANVCSSAASVVLRLSFDIFPRPIKGGGWIVVQNRLETG